jgi:hypothetical protein
MPRSGGTCEVNFWGPFLLGRQAIKICLSPSDGSAHQDQKHQPHVSPFLDGILLYGQENNVWQRKPFGTMHETKSSEARFHTKAAYIIWSHCDESMRCFLLTRLCLVLPFRWSSRVPLVIMVIFHNVDYNSMCLPWLLLFLECKKIFHDLMIILLASGECRVQE